MSEVYLSSAEEDCDVLEYWKVRSSDVRYSGPAQMARDYLIVQATSVSSEQIFSVAKHTISPTRIRLSTENIRALKLGMKQILLIIIRKINKISTNII